MEDLEKLRADFNIHTTQDAEQFACINDKLDDIHITLKNTQDLMKKVDAGTGFLKWWFDNGSKVGSFVIVLLGLWLFVKYGALSAFKWLTNNFL